MSTLLTLLLWGVVVYGALVAIGTVAERLLRRERRCDSIHFAISDDGRRLALSRYRGGPERARAGAVLLVPGMAQNGAVFDCGDPSLARVMAADGFDTWVLDPRGRGGSGRPELGGRHRYRWSFDQLVDPDLPAAIELVRRQSSADGVHLIGFGCGGLACLALLGGSGEQRAVISCATLGAAAYFRRQQEHISARLLRLLRYLRPRLPLRLLSPLLGRYDLPLLRPYQHVDNIEPVLYRRAMVLGVDNLAPSEAAQLARWIDTDRFAPDDALPARDEEARADYRSRLSEITVPTLLIAGARDQLAPPSMVNATYSALGGEGQHEVDIVGRQTGASSNYGHLDLLLGHGAQRDVYARLIDWLDRHEQPRAELDGAAEVALDDEGVADDELERSDADDDLERSQVDDDLERSQVDDDLERSQVDDELERSQVGDEPRPSEADEQQRPGEQQPQEDGGSPSQAALPREQHRGGDGAEPGSDPVTVSESERPAEEPGSR